MERKFTPNKMYQVEIIEAFNKYYVDIRSNHLYNGKLVSEMIFATESEAKSYANDMYNQLVQDEKVFVDKYPKAKIYA